MIDKVLSLLKDELTEHVRLRAKLDSTAEPVSLTSFTDKNGVIAIPTNTVGVTLFNIDEERVMKTQGRVARDVNGRVQHLEPEVRLNLYILWAARFTDYDEALKFISYIIGYFQKKRVINHQNTPKLSPDLSELAVDLYAMSLEQQNYLWSILGGRYLPSVAYQIRPVLIQDDEVLMEQSPVTELRVSAASGPVIPIQN